MPKFNHSKGEKIRSHESKRAIQDSDATITRMREAQNAAELERQIRESGNDKK